MPVQKKKHRAVSSLKRGTGYQTLINAELRAAVARAAGNDGEPLTVAKLREVLLQELHAAQEVRAGG